MTTTALAKTTAATPDPAAANRPLRARRQPVRTLRARRAAACSWRAELRTYPKGPPPPRARRCGQHRDLSVADGAAPVGERCERRQLEKELPRQVRRFESVHETSDSIVAANPLRWRKRLGPIVSVRACSHAVGAEVVPRGQWAAGSARDGGRELCRASTKRPAIALLRDLRWI